MGWFADVGAATAFKDSLGISLMAISTAAFIGGLGNFVLSKIKPESSEKGVIVSSGMLGGEGVTGVLIAIIKVITMG